MPPALVAVLATERVPLVEKMVAPVVLDGGYVAVGDVDGDNMLDIAVVAGKQATVYLQR